MIDAPLDVVTALPVSRLAPAAHRDAAFSQVLQQAARGRDREAARDAATRLVSSVFVMPVLASMHDSPLLEPPFAPTFAQKGLGEGRAEINPVLCKGCGLCVSSCRSGAINLKGFGEEQIMAMINEV